MNMIHIIRERATPQQIQEMLQDLETDINIDPQQGNRSLEIVIPVIRE